MTRNMIKRVEILFPVEDKRNWKTPSRLHGLTII